MPEKWFTLPVDKVEKTRDVYGKFIGGDVTPYKGWFLDRAEIVFTRTGESVGTTGLFWMPSKAELKENDVLRYKGEYYNIVRIARIRKAGVDEVAFQKCWVQKMYDMGVS